MASADETTAARHGQRFAGEVLVAAGRMASEGAVTEEQVQLVQRAVLRASADGGEALEALLGAAPAFADPVAAREAVMTCLAIVASTTQAPPPPPAAAAAAAATVASPQAEDDDWAVVELASQLEEGDLVVADFEAHSAPAARTLADSERQQAWEALGAGMETVAGLTPPTAALLRRLESEGVLYPRHDVVYRAKYLDRVPPLGDCLFLSVAAILAAEAGMPGGSSLPPMTSQELRKATVEHFLRSYSDAMTAEERASVDQRIRNQYAPDLTRGWGVSRVQATCYVVPVALRDELLARRLELQERGSTELAAAEQVYKAAGEAVVDAATYCRLMGVAGVAEDDEYFAVSFHYTQLGLHGVDDGNGDPRPTWGDDLMLDHMSAMFRREIFVVLASAAADDEPLDTGSVLFLSHVAEELRAPGVGRWRAPWFLLMRGNNANGGDHYDPMIAFPGMGGGSASFEPL